jgi:hypothetical protein
MNNQQGATFHGGIRDMRFGVRVVGLLVLAFAVPVLADEPSSPPPNKDAKKYVEVGQMQGKLERVDTSKSEMVLAYAVPQGRSSKTERKELDLADDAKVWFVTAPERTDENGQPKKLTREELDKLKSKYGPTKGLYAGELADLHPGQQVKIVLGKPQDAVKKPAPKEKGVAPEKEFVYVTMVLVTVDAKVPAKPDKKK